MSSASVSGLAVLPPLREPVQTTLNARPFTVPSGSIHELRDVLRSYRERDLDFCVDTALVSSLLDIDTLRSVEIIIAFTESEAGL